MAGQLKIGGNVIATHAGSEGAGTVPLDSSTLTIGSNTTVQGQVQYSALPVGTVIQTQTTTLSSTSTGGTTSTDHVSTGLAVTITPKFSNSKMLISWNSGSTHLNGSNDNCRGNFAIFKDSGSGNAMVPKSEANIVVNGGGLVSYFNFSSQAIDTVSNTNATTYTLMAKRYTGTFYYFNPYSGSIVDVCMSVMEIKQ